MKKKLIKLSILSIVIFLSLSIFQLSTFADDLLDNNTFDNSIGLPWTLNSSAPANADFEIKDGKYNIKILNQGIERWDIQFRHRSISLVKGNTYTVKFNIKADKNAEFYAKIGDTSDPYFEDWNMGNKTDWSPRKLTANKLFTWEESFTATRTVDNLELAFHLGGTKVISGTTFTLDDIYLNCQDYTKPSPIITPSPKLIRVNQIGYYPDLAKTATFKTDSETAHEWQLVNNLGEVVASGTTKLFGKDKDSGDNVQLINFSSFETSGKNYKLRIDGNESQLFDINKDIYKSLVYDSLKYFYYVRSGIPIKMPYCVEPQYERVATHNPDIVSTESSTSGYNHVHSLDVTGGWYNFGGYGKYSVSSGIALWTMQNQFERTKYLKKANLDLYADNKMNIPESNNGIPDILDEARVQLEVMMKLQIPAGMPSSGMVHVCAIDDPWTSIGLMPQNKIKRVLRAPSTDATLNLAATAAQGSRLWEKYDSTFARKCLIAAETAWQAALLQPNITAPTNNEMTSYFIDDFYWAASELFITTGKTEYYEYLKKSEYFLTCNKIFKTTSDRNPDLTPYNFYNTSTLGTLSLALVPNDLSATEKSTSIKNITSSADYFLSLIKTQGYGIPYRQSYSDYNYELGYELDSNFEIMNNSIILANAFDFSNESKYINGVSSSMDYLLGRNPLDFSFISGYGDKSVQNPNILFFANQSNSNLPKVPKGFVVSGPTTVLYDNYSKSAGMRSYNTPPQKCYIDNIEAWSSNECTVYLNASLSWLAGFMLESENLPIYTLGDVDDNGSITSTDVALIYRHLLGNSELIESRFFAADTNIDGRISSSDISKLERFLLRIIPSLR